MYSMGMLSRLLTQWAGAGSVRSIETRFAAMLPVKASLHCEGVIEAVEATEGGSLVTVKLAATQADGSAVAAGSAQVFVAAGR
jgi:acyl dehydratase